MDCWYRFVLQCWVAGPGWQSSPSVQQLLQFMTARSKATFAWRVAGDTAILTLNVGPSKAAKGHMTSSTNSFPDRSNGRWWSPAEDGVAEQQPLQATSLEQPRISRTSASKHNAHDPEGRWDHASSPWWREACLRAAPGPHRGYHHCPAMAIPRDTSAS